jgi:hypothetical protein
MQEEFQLSSEQSELESQLRKLSPTDGQIDVISAAFTAGRRSMRFRLAAWQSSAGLMLLLAAALSLRALLQRPPSAQSFIAGAPSALAEQAQAVTAPPPQSLAVLRKAVRDGGLDALPQAALPDIKPLRAGDLF